MLKLILDNCDYVDICPKVRIINFMFIENVCINNIVE